MASIRYRKGAWRIRYRDLTGRWVERSTTAKTKGEAKQLAAEIERRIERQEHGIDPLPRDERGTFWQLCEWWLAKHCPQRSHPNRQLQLTKHLKETRLGALSLAHVTKSAIADRLREMERGGSSPGTVNKVRSILHTVIHRAMQEDPPIWTGANPVELIESRRVPRRLYEVLAPDEIETVLRFTPADWQGEFATAIFMGLRKGEILGLRPEDVDLTHGILRVRHSFAGPTKSSREDVLPIPPMLVPYLRAALDRGGPVLFPCRTGRNRGKARTCEADPQKILRRALGRAGLVTGYEYVCRRCKAAGRKPHAWPHRVLEERRCETCGMRLWPVAIPRPMRFHDLRHSMATLLLGKMDPQKVQLLMRHARIATTIGVYNHMVPEAVRTEMEEAWTRILPGPKGPNAPPEGGTNGGSFVPVPPGTDPHSSPSGGPEAPRDWAPVGPGSADGAQGDPPAPSKPRRKSRLYAL